MADEVILNKEQFIKCSIYRQLNVTDAHIVSLLASFIVVTIL